MSSMIIPTVRNATLLNECDRLPEELNMMRGRALQLPGKVWAFIVCSPHFFLFVNSFLYSF